MNSTRTVTRPSSASATSESAAAAAARLRLALASPADRLEIAGLRHDVYARELRQHPLNAEGRLEDALDGHNVYLVARRGGRDGEMLGFVSVTPPSAPRFSLEKYVGRERLPFPIDARTFEVRLLTVVASHRGTKAGPLLMYAALRYVESAGGERIVGIGRREVFGLYQRFGLEPAGIAVRSGEVDFEVMHASVVACRKAAEADPNRLARAIEGLDWDVADVAPRPPAACFHGGASFEAMGEAMGEAVGEAAGGASDDPSRAGGVIPADVLDAWFDPSPRVVDALRARLPWLIRTSPPTGCEGLLRTIASVRGVGPEHLVAGGGSSDLIFLALRHWLRPGSRVLLLDPTYGEYAHVLERIVGCRVDRLILRREENYALSPIRLIEAATRHRYDLVVLVNPNSPTGRHVPRARLEAALGELARTTRIWIDETYVDYAGPDESLERFAAASANVIVCKSMSKAYALSGLRVAYLCGPAPVISELRPLNPPWAVCLPGQVAAVAALGDPTYYAGRYAQTHALRAELAAMLRGQLGFEVVDGAMANFLLAHMPESGPSAGELVDACRRRGLFLRDASCMGTAASGIGRHAVRIAVRDAATNERMASILRMVLNPDRLTGG